MFKEFTKPEVLKKAGIVAAGVTALGATIALFRFRHCEVLS